jgi:MFS family permease
MQVVAPDLVADVRELSAPVTSAGLALGLALWVFGWRGHRFWVVLSATVCGGIAGLVSAQAYGVQPLVAGLLAAVAAGVLALALVRVLAFLAGGIAACVMMHAVAPSWDQPLVTLLVGGLIGVFLFRLGMMAFTSTAGTLLTAYCALALLDRLGTLDCHQWPDGNVVLLNWLCGSGAVLGVLMQFVLERRRLYKQRKREEAARQKAAEEAEKKKSKPPPAKTSWLPWGQGNKRRAG